MAVERRLDAATWQQCARSLPLPASPGCRGHIHLNLLPCCSHPPGDEYAKAATRRALLEVRVVAAMVPQQQAMHMVAGLCGAAGCWRCLPLPCSCKAAVQCGLL